MSYKVKGTAGPVIQSQRLTYDPEDATFYNEVTYGGSAKAIQGLSNEFRQKNKGHYATLEDNGAGQLTLRQPIGTKVDEIESSVRYEISNEFIEIDGFRHKTVSDDADAFDIAVPEGAGTYRSIAEDAVNSGAAFAANSILGRMITHLRKGVTGFEREYIILKRSRKVPFAGLGSIPQATILDGRFIYSTAQLGIPAAVAFALPDLSSLPASGWTDVQWGWRRRPSSVVFEGEFIEQSSEFALAEWSLLFYELAGGPASW